MVRKKTKTCSKCSENKPISAFSKNQAWCKDCVKAYNKKYYNKNQDKCKAQSKVWNEENPEKVKGYYQKWKKTHPDAYEDHKKEWSSYNSKNKTRKCPKCLKDKSISSFSQNQTWCKDCVKIWNEENPEKQKGYYDKWKKKHPEAYEEHRAEWNENRGLNYLDKINNT